MKKRQTRGALALQKWRDAQGSHMTQHRVAVALDAKSVFTVSKWERGVQVPTVAEALAIEKFTKGAVRVAWWAETSIAEKETKREPVSRRNLGAPPEAA